MKKTILLLLAALCGVLTTAAQDLIIKHDASQIEAKVVEISADAVRYKRFSNPDGPTYVLPTGEIRSIQYANGETETFAAPQSIPATRLTPATPAGDSSAACPTGQAPQQYQLGDIYDCNGVKGIVWKLSDGRDHGMILSLDEIFLHWSSFRKPDLRVAGANERTDGALNMEIVARYIADNNLSWDDFPAFKWCLEKGEGWYLPAIDELLIVGHNYNGGTRMQNNRQARNKFNETLKTNGGERMDRLVYYFSSTEMDEKSAYTTHMGIEPPYVIEIPKNNKFLVRAVRKF